MEQYLGFVVTFVAKIPRSLRQNITKEWCCLVFCAQNNGKKEHQCIVHSKRSYALLSYRVQQRTRVCIETTGRGYWRVR